MSRAALIFTFLLFWLSAAHAVEPVVKNHHIVTYKTEGTFKEVKESLSLALDNRGLVISSISHIGDMLERTGKSLGASKKVFLEAESIEFCSSTISRASMEADPHNIVFCPYIIAIYVLPAEPNTVYLSYRPPELVGDQASRGALQQVGQLIDGLIRDALQW